MKKITDKMRLDWMENEGVLSASPFGGRWKVYSENNRTVGSGSSFRQAIDDAIRAERRGEKA